MNYYADNDPLLCNWLTELIAAGLIPKGKVDERDIRQTTAADLVGYHQVHMFAGIGGWAHALQLAGWPHNRPVWTGSCPCQPFSQSGKRKGSADDRHLWPEFARLIRECRPDVCFGEQVASPDAYAWLDLVSADLEGMGYAVGSVVTPAAGYGAPHARHRIYWVADSRRSPSQRHKRSRLGDAQTSGLFGKGSREKATESPGGSSTRELAIALGNANSTRPQERPEPEVFRGPLRIDGAALGWADPLRGFWRGADWLYCRDGKYRSVEPGTFPLAHGISARMVKLRGYGNAICIPQAIAFIKAYLETTIECQQSIA